MIEIYYVEDDVDISCAVKEFLGQQGYNVSVFSTVASAKEALASMCPTLVLVDWNMPDGRGDRLCQWIRSNWREMPVIFLTVRGDASDIVSGFAGGADDYVVKPFELEVLYSRILALLRRSGGTSGQYLSCAGISMDLNRRRVLVHAREVSLGLAEYQLLLYLMQNKGRTLTREKILEHVWDVNGSYVNDNTLTVTMKRLRDKLEEPSCLKTVRSVGYRMEDEI